MTSTSQGILRLPGRDGRFTCGDTQAPTTFADIVLGAKGAYAGAQGEAVTDCASETSADVTLRLLHASGQPPVPVKLSQARVYKTFGGLDFDDDSIIYAGATASPFVHGTKRSVGTSRSLYGTALDLPPAAAYFRSLGIVSFDLKGGTIRAVAYDEGPVPSIEKTRTLVITGGTASTSARRAPSAPSRVRAPTNAWS